MKAERLSAVGNLSNLGQGVTSQCNQAWLSPITICTGTGQEKEIGGGEEGSGDACPLVSVHSNNFKVYE